MIILEKIGTLIIWILALIVTIITYIILSPYLFIKKLRELKSKM